MNIVILSGGTGNTALVNGLIKHGKVDDITVITNMYDNGKSARHISHRPLLRHWRSILESTLFRYSHRWQHTRHRLHQRHRNDADAGCDAEMVYQAHRPTYYLRRDIGILYSLPAVDYIIKTHIKT